MLNAAPRQQASRPDTAWARRALTDQYATRFLGPPCPIGRAGQTQDVGRRPQSGLVGSQRASGRWSRDLSGFPHAPFGRVSGSCSAPPQTIPGVRPMSHVSQRRDTWHTLGHCMTRKTQSLRGHMLWHRSCAWRRPLLRGLRHQRSAPSWSSNLNGRCREEIRSELPSSLRSSFAAFPQQGDGCDREVPNSSTWGPRPRVQRLRAARFRLPLV